MIKPRLKKFFKISLTIILFCIIGIYAFMKQDKFVSPVVDITRTYKAPFTNGIFENSPPTELMTGEKDSNKFKALIDFVFKTIKDAKPSSSLPSIKTDLLKLNQEDNIIVWMGHSSFFMQLDGKTYLIDPVFSDNASPIPYTNLAFAGSNIYKVEDLPKINVLLISHDHWDHLDEPTLKKLKPKIANVVVPVGVDSYLKQWGYAQDIIKTGDWNDEFILDDVSIHVLQAQHFSGRLLKGNRTLWCSFAIVTPKHKIYLSGDSSYGEFFKDLGKRFGSFDVAILENGQYDKDWSKIHMMPEETAQAGVDLNAQSIIPCHNSKFKLSKHSWNAPLENLSKASENKSYTLKTPMIGQPVDIDNKAEFFEKWEK